MNYKSCSGEKEIFNTYWNVFSSFGYEEAVIDGEISGENKTVRLIEDCGNLKCRTVLCGENNDKCMAEAAAVCIESALAVGFPDFKIYISSTDMVKELLYLYGLDDYADFSEGDFSICGKSGNNILFSGELINGAIVCTFDLSSGCKAMEGGVQTHAPSKTIVYAEKNAEGIAYEISYNLRLSGCLVMMYTGDGAIEKCEEEALSSGVSDIIRVFPDGKLQIKSLWENEITETDYETFVGYYNEDDEECECGHEHHHNCECGHEHHHDCDCGCEH